MSQSEYVIDEIPGLYKIIALHPLRRTKKVSFDVMPQDTIPKVDSIDRVIHEAGAFSPGSLGGVERPWYMHPYQDDNLLVLFGTRIVDLYSETHGKVVTFELTPDSIKMNGELVFEGPAILVWPCFVYHRVISGDEGSASVNLATHYAGFNLDTNFNIYDLDQETGISKVLRKGVEDQQ